MTKEDARAIIIATARKLFKGESWNVPNEIYLSAFGRYGTFDDPDFTVSDRNTFYQIRRMK